VGEIIFTILLTIYGAAITFAFYHAFKR